MGKDIRSNGNRWLYLILGIFCMLFAGVIYAWSILKVPLQTEFNWSVSALALNFTLTMCFFCMGGLFGSSASKYFSPKIVIIASGLLAGSGFLIASNLSGSNIYSLYISYGLMAGLGIGAAYNIILSVVVAWFPDKKGVCSGLLLMGFGASTLILGNIFDILFASESFGWRATYRILGIALCIVMIITGLILKKPLPTVSNEKQVKKNTSSSKDYSTKEMLKRPSFWKAFIGIACLAAIGNSVISFAKDLSLNVGASVTMATTLVGVLSVFNGVGRILTGIIFDKFGQRFTMIFAGAFTVFSVAIMLSAIFSKSVLFCTLALCLIGISYGSCPTISSALIAHFYGEKYYSTNFAIMNFNLMVASSMATISGMIVSATGGYVILFFVLLILSTFALLLNISIRHP